MPRIDDDDVIAILDFDPSITDLTRFISAAEQLVDRQCVPTGKYNASELANIEMWLAAHFVAIRDPRYASETMGAASVTMQNKIGMNLGSTPYGQQAMLLDDQGGLAYLDQHISVGKRARPRISYLGTKKCGDSPWLFRGLF